MVGSNLFPLLVSVNDIMTWALPHLRKDDIPNVMYPTNIKIQGLSEVFRMPLPYQGGNELPGKHLKYCQIYNNLQ